MMLDAGVGIRYSPHLLVSNGMYSYRKVKEGNVREVVRIYWYLSALCRFKVTHLTVDVRIYPQPSLTTPNYPQL